MKQTIIAGIVICLLLEALALKSKRAVDPLIAALKDADKKARAKAAWALGKI